MDKVPWPRQWGPRLSIATAERPCRGIGSLTRIRCDDGQPMDVVRSARLASVVRVRREAAPDADALQATALLDLSSGDTSASTMRRSISFLETSLASNPWRRGTQISRRRDCRTDPLTMMQRRYSRRSTRQVMRSPFVPMTHRPSSTTPWRSTCSGSMGKPRRHGGECLRLTPPLSGHVKRGIESARSGRSVHRPLPVPTRRWTTIASSHARRRLTRNCSHGSRC